MATSHQFLAFRPTLGLLTTVADLPHNYKIRYVTPESPLDLSVKPGIGPITPPSTPSPIKKRFRYDLDTDLDSSPHCKSIKLDESDSKKLQISKEITPKKPIKTVSPPKTSKSHPPPKERKNKAARKLKFDETNSSPVSGTVIRPLEEIDENIQESGDIDPQYNIVEITDEAKAELALIPNIIGSYTCKLCRNEFDDAFGLAQHRCSCIVLLEYLCPECGKRFNCPANLASHRRWHKPKDEVLKKQQENTENDQQFQCGECGKFFKRQAYLRKHTATHKSKIKPEFKEMDAGSAGCYRSDESNSSDETTEKKFYKRQKFAESIGGDSDSSLQSFQSGSSGIINNNNNNNKTLQRIFKSDFTDDENLAVAALAHLRNGPSVIKHTTTALVIR